MSETVRCKHGGDKKWEALQEVAKHGRSRLLAYGLSEHYVEILIITRLSDFVVVYSDEESALSKASVS